MQLSRYRHIREMRNGKYKIAVLLRYRKAVLADISGKRIRLAIAEPLAVLAEQHLDGSAVCIWIAVRTGDVYRPCDRRCSGSLINNACVCQFNI